MTEKTASDSLTPHAGRCGTATKHHLIAGTARAAERALPRPERPPPLPTPLLFSSSLQFDSVAAAGLQAGVELFLHPHLLTIDAEAKQKTREAHWQSNTKERSGNGRRRRFEFRTFLCVQGQVSGIRPAPPAQCTQTPF
jgi:hypothetical protein